MATPAPSHEVALGVVLGIVAATPGSWSRRAYIASLVAAFRAAGHPVTRGLIVPSRGTRDGYRGRLCIALRTLNTAIEVCTYKADRHAIPKLLHAPDNYHTLIIILSRGNVPQDERRSSRYPPKATSTRKPVAIPSSIVVVSAPRPP